LMPSFFRYSQLLELMEFYTQEESFDAAKYWNYGCNCMIHGDRPLSDMGTGPGVDRLDKKCREYKLCQQCARGQHGDMCIGEFINYSRPRTRTVLNDYGVEETHKVCRDSPNTCERSLCECDLQFAKDHAKVSVSFWIILLVVYFNFSKKAEQSETNQRVRSEAS
jgi:hypothetical protein